MSAALEVCPRKGCERPVPEDTVWSFRGQFYCSVGCAAAESFDKSSYAPPGYYPEPERARRL